ncbi:biopolymer transporter ExbD [Xanthomonadaceae bacterium JHOS43]|jgi:biopolymer transport protein ExbD|nr:biopolymer transporter ExbD [Xanthomonadaceae bacterium JHOS43]MCX7562014.1 biopolymer transporter ExbD [Xanthomonadaceae bacterium XH05]
MAFSSNGSGGGGPMAEINVTPLVDVMLVLLIIFMITAPLMAHKVEIKLPEANLDVKPDDPSRPITLAIKENGDIFWNDDPITRMMLESQLALEAQKKPQPRIDIRADRTTRYKVVQEVVRTAKNVGIAKVGFVATKEN